MLEGERRDIEEIFGNISRIFFFFGKGKGRRRKKKRKKEKNYLFLVRTYMKIIKFKKHYYLSYSNFHIEVIYFFYVRSINCIQN